VDNFASSNGKTLLANLNETAILQLEAIDPDGDSITFSLEGNDSIPGVMIAYDFCCSFYQIFLSFCFLLLLKESVKMNSKKAFSQ